MFLEWPFSGIPSRSVGGQIPDSDRRVPVVALMAD